MKLALMLFISFISISNIASAFYKSESLMQSFVVIGDTGKLTTAQRNVADAMKRVCDVSLKNCDSAFLVGDVIYHAGMKTADDPIMDRVFRDFYEELGFPFYVILGNHDYGRLSMSYKRGGFQLEYSKRNPQFVMPDRFYVKVFKHAVVAFLDTTRMMWKRDILVQAEMVQKASLLAKEQGMWFIVVGHHPYLSNGDHGNAGHYDRLKFPYFISGKYVKRFLDRYVCNEADIYFSGHDHSLQFLPGEQIGCKSYIVVSGAGGSGSGLKARNTVDFESGNPGFVHLETSENELVLTAIGEQGEEIFTKTLAKP